MLAADDRADDVHARGAGDVRDDVMDLQVHLRQRLLHMLNVRRSIIEQPLALAQIGPQNRNLPFRLEAASQQAVGM